MTDVRQDYDLREVCEMLIEEAINDKNFIKNYKYTEKGKSKAFTKKIIELLKQVLEEMTNPHHPIKIDSNKKVKYKN